jgi:transcriptional regulator with XRE-family HTH domain
MLFREALGIALRNLRIQKGLTLRQTSARSFMALGYLSEVERGQKEASSEFIERLAATLGISTTMLIVEAAYLMPNAIPDTPAELVREIANAI